VRVIIMSASDPIQQIAFALLREERAHTEYDTWSRAELHGQARELADLIRDTIHDDICTNCWMVFSNGANRSCTTGGECLSCLES